VNESAPEYPAVGVYVTVAESVFGVPATQALSVVAPRLPWVGPVTIANVSWHVSGSLPERLTVPAVLKAVVLLVALAVGVVFVGVPSDSVACQ